jgi:hypothetical protein
MEKVLERIPFKPSLSGFPVTPSVNLLSQFFTNYRGRVIMLAAQMKARKANSDDRHRKKSKPVTDEARDH